MAASSRRFAGITLIALYVLLAGTFRGPVAPPAIFAADPAANPLEEAVRAYEAQDKKRVRGRPVILFLGDDVVRQWDLGSTIPDVAIEGRGLAKARLADLYQLAPRIAIPYNPKLIVVYAGDEDLAAGQTPEQVVEVFKDFVARIHSRLAQTRIMYISIAPSPGRARLLDAQRKTNELILDFRVKNRVLRLDYVDLASALVDSDGKLLPNLYEADGRTLSAAGYKKLADVLAPHLQALLGVSR